MSAVTPTNGGAVVLTTREESTEATKVCRVNRDGTPLIIGRKQREQNSLLLSMRVEARGTTKRVQGKEILQPKKSLLKETVLKEARKAVAVSMKSLTAVRKESSSSDGFNGIQASSISSNSKRFFAEEA